MSSPSTQQTLPPFAAVKSPRTFLGGLLAMLGVLFLLATVSFNVAFGLGPLEAAMADSGLPEYPTKVVRGLWMVHNVHLFGLGILALVGGFFTASVRPWILLFAGALAATTGLAMIAAVGTFEGSIFPVFGGLALGASALASWAGR